MYVAPANPAGRNLERRLTAAGYDVLGLVDNLKRDEGVINYPVQAEAYDFLIVAEGRFQSDICDGLLDKGFEADRLLLQVSGELSFKRYRRAVGRNILMGLSQFWCRTIIAAGRILPSTRVIYYAETFVDTNVLLAWSAHTRDEPGGAVLVAFDIPGGFANDVLCKKNAVVNRRYLGFWHLVRARVIVVDHEYTTARFSELRKTKRVVQLWHGLPYKALSGNSHFEGVCDHAFVSSSHWFNEHIFRTIFRARAYYNFGYPRCDALLQSPEQRDWIGSVPRARLQMLQSKLGPLWVYMPTYRDNGENTLPLDFDSLNRFCREHQRSLVLKLHPFLVGQLRTGSDALNSSGELTPLNGLSNIFIYPPALNIYTWLADAEVLITDYSSVALDFLVLRRPIVYFQYDKVDYHNVRGAPLIDDQDYEAGRQVADQSELHAELQRLTVGEPKTVMPQDRLIEKYGVAQTEAVPQLLDYLRGLK
ncbi:CDP-glycerol glycerophosphotransferase family protein [Marinobacter sp. LV10MA510-1]|uniref:CDP-glycerol glycerophosphotransferase family protein n=1 Tax=Marinobacter sp. LV10MA510-1 TaxID=1415567 RepID=UPI000BF9200E|nr:CDP-glycerol glycerophosphotransferase family protein [Marinobacter sp. LV10MA510-1]